ncbi:MAG: co-chaperone GroES family protein [Bacteroidetes bacterium]|nr:co-chaperone GroES family protein [Bacteroidota bacterium]MBU1116988.1 co-chaperone GroES family protein [Bacteroidota bacterium]MBU1797324.1 co-chaperone GroES family protein [Bacteroidota bacterium]
MIDTQKIIIVGDKVLIRPFEGNKKSQGGLYLPPNVIEKEKVHSGYVLKVGPGYPVGAPTEDETWKSPNATKYIPLEAMEGDQALFLKKDAIEIELDGEKLVIVAQSAILLLVRDNDLLNIK